MGRKSDYNKPVAERWMNYSDLFHTIYDNLKDYFQLTNSKSEKFTVQKHNPQVLQLIFGIVPGNAKDADGIQENDEDILKDLSSKASAYDKGTKPLPQAFANVYNNTTNKQKIYRYVQENIYSQIMDENKLETELRILIKNTPDCPQKRTISEIKRIDELLAESIIMATSYRVKVMEEKQRIREKLSTKVFDEGIDLKNDKKELTHAISILLEGRSLEYLPNGIKEFHDFDTLLEYIMEKRLLIIKVISLCNSVKVFVMPSKYCIKKIEISNYMDALAFIAMYQNEFHPKYNWPKYSIVKLASQGLKQRKWIPYGYYLGNELVGYIDFKYTIARGIEIGIELIGTEHRSLALATSLLFFVRLKFPNLCTFSGTYEGNEGMRATFAAAGYVIDQAKGVGGIVRDRINVEEPKNEKLYTNSVCYIAPPILEKYDCTETEDWCSEEKKDSVDE